MIELVKIREDRNITIAVDGGVNVNTISKVYDTGIDVTIVGSGLYKAKDIDGRFNELMTI